MKKPKFNKRSGSIMIVRKSKEIASETNIEKGMQVTVDYQGATVTIKVIEKVSEKSFTGTIVKFSEYTSPSKYNDLSINDSVEFHKDQIIMVEQE